jgi:rhodanese-related sulfurtransferase
MGKTGTIQRLQYHAVVILLLAVGCGVVSQLVRRDRLPWFEDWSNYIEAKALKEGIPLVAVKQAMAILQSGTHVILDARPAADYEAGHIPTALSVPYDSVADALVNIQQRLAPSRPIMTYCSGKNCDESFLLTQYLRRQGFTNVVLFAGGFETWNKEGHPVERGGR